MDNLDKIHSIASLYFVIFVMALSSRSNQIKETIFYSEIKDTCRICHVDTDTYI